MGCGSLNPIERTPMVPTRGKLSHENSQDDPRESSPNPQCHRPLVQVPMFKDTPTPHVRAQGPESGNPTKRQRSQETALPCKGRAGTHRDPEAANSFSSPSQSPQSQQHFLALRCHSGVLASQQGCLARAQHLLVLSIRSWQVECSCDSLKDHPFQ